MADTKAKLTLNGDTAVELDVLKGTLGQDVIDIRTLGSKGVFTFDPGFTSTASCESKITFIDEYNQMINYYNKRYLTQYNNLSNCMIDIKNIKHSQQEGIQFKTKKIVPRGFTYQILFNENINIPLDILYIGIGNFNFIGGGELET